MSPNALTRRRALRTALASAAGLALHRPFVSHALQDAPTFETLPPAAPRDGGRLDVVTTMPLLTDLAWQIGGIRVNASSLTAANDDLHTVELKETAVAELREADVVIRFGLKLDRWASPAISAADVDASTATSGVATIPIEGDAEGDVDPHVWFDPRNVKVMAVNVAEALGGVDPAGADSYLARLDAYQRQLDQLDAWIMERISSVPVERRLLVTTHAAFAYFVRRYGLTFVGSAIPGLSTRNQVTRRNTAAMIDAIAVNGVEAVFAEPSVASSAAADLAERAGTELVDGLYGDNLGEPGSGAGTYLEMMVWNTNLIVDALG